MPSFTTSSTSTSTWTCLFLLFTLPQTLPGQGTRADYDRAARLPEVTRDKVVGGRVDPHWLTDNRHFWYLAGNGTDVRQFMLVDATTGEKQPAFDHARLAESLGKSADTPCDAHHLPFDWIQFDDAGTTLTFRAFDRGWQCPLDSYVLTEADVAPPPDRRGRRSRRERGPSQRPEADSPDGKWAAFARDNQVWVRNRESSEETAWTTDGAAEHFYEDRFFWSPDSTKLVAMKTKRGGDRRVHLIESSPKDQLQPKLDSYDYLKPGDEIPLTKPCLFDAATRQPIVISDALFPNPWSVDEVRWDPDSQRFTFLYNQRGHQVLRVIAVRADNGEATTVIDEQSSTFIDYAGKHFAHYTEDGSEAIWMSERSGWNHLYLYDLRAAAVKNPITQGEWVVRDVEFVDEKNRVIWFRAGGVHAGQDPYYIHYGRVQFDGSGLTWLTAGDGTHTARFSPDRSYLVDTYSRVDAPPVVELRRGTDGTLVCELERADMTALSATGWQTPERFAAKGRDGSTDIFGVIWRPTTFDPQRTYPVIENIYAGPQDSFVPKGFSPYYREQALAELGFVVVQIDGMGTSNRSKAFHDVCCKNLADAGLPDRIAWIQAAGAKYPYLDLTRIGIYGGSAGAQSALGGLLFHGDFYKVGVADCGCHDNRMDKIWWNELWMGWPIGPHYAEQSNVVQAHRLTGKLLLIVGELDKNVDPSSTMQVVNALIQADKDFDMLVVPGGGHGIAESPYGNRRRCDFFVRHLLGVEPRGDTP